MNISDLRFLLAAAAIGFGPPVAAQLAGVSPDFANAMFRASTQFQLQQSMTFFTESQMRSFSPVDTEKSASPKRAQLTAVSTQINMGTVTFPRKLAQHYPPISREQAEKTFIDLLSKYHEVERSLGVPKNDLAGAVAMFLSGSFEAYTDTSIEPSHFKVLVAQMRQVIGGNPDFAKASNAEKQEMYEQMAILGMFMAATQDELSRKPSPQIAANMKQAAKGYLEQFLKTDADRVRITDRGLEIH